MTPEERQNNQEEQGSRNAPRNVPDDKLENASPDDARADEKVIVNHRPHDSRAQISKP